MTAVRSASSLGELSAHMTRNAPRDDESAAPARPGGRPQRSGKESNLPSAGLPRLPGFEDRLGHQTRSAPPRIMPARRGAHAAAALLLAALSLAAGLSVLPTPAGASARRSPARAEAAGASAGNARVTGVFAMNATVTSAVRVRGEHPGERLRRTWTLDPSRCHGSVCGRLRLERQRSAGIVELVRLKRTGPGRYAGSGAFDVALSCLGHVYRLGSRVPFRITLVVTAAVRVQGINFARRIKATYVNPARTDATPCPLGPSHDAARYTGTLSSPVPSPPTAAFSAAVNASDETGAFADASRRGAGGAAIRARSWTFGDPGSGVANHSTVADPTHRFSAPGTYTVTLTVTDANGLTSTTAQTVTVPPPSPVPLPAQRSSRTLATTRPSSATRSAGAPAPGRITA